MLTTSQIELIRASYRQIAFRLMLAGETFYRHLFRLHPELQPLFKSDMNNQSMKLMQTIGFAVAHLHMPQTLNPMVQQLGERHRGYGVESHHFAYVGEALLLTLSELLGEGFTPDVQAAWEALYHQLATLATQDPMLS